MQGMRRVVVTGMGIACPLGVGVDHVWKRLIEGQSGITAIQGFDTTELTAKIAGQVPVGTKAEGKLDISEWIPVKDQKHFAASDDPRIVGSDVTKGSEEGGRTAMENILQKADNINVVYGINEPAVAGGYAAMKAADKLNGVLFVGVDGGCPGVRNIAAGTLGATSQQYPLKMAALGVQAVVDFMKTGVKPAKTPGLDFTDTGVTLITDKPVAGVPSITSAEGLKLCWG